MTGHGTPRALFRHDSFFRLKPPQPSLPPSGPHAGDAHATMQGFHHMVSLLNDLWTIFSITS
jgi:hypothetical protein